MAVEIPGFKVGILQAAADLREKQYHIVKVTGIFEVNLTSVKGERGLGILQNKPNTNEAADVWPIAISKVVIGAGGLTAGTQYEAAADGTAITAEVGKIALGEVIKGGSAGELATVTIGLPCGVTVGA